MTILSAQYKPDRKEFKVQATSSVQPDAVLTVVGFGQMTFKNGKYELKIRPVPNPRTVTVTSSFGGSETKIVHSR